MEALQSGASQSVDTSQSSCEFPTEFDTNPENHIDSTFKEDFLVLISNKENGALSNQELANFIKDQARTNATFLLDGAEQYGILLDTEIADETRFVSNGCLTSEGVDILHRFNNKIDTLHHDLSTTPPGMHTSAQGPEGNIYITNATDIYAGTPAIKSVDPVTGEVFFITTECGNRPRFSYQAENIPRDDLPQQPVSSTSDQPKDDAGVNPPEGTWGKVDRNPSQDNIGSENKAPASPQVKDKGSSKWADTPSADSQVTPGSESNTAVAPGATKPSPETPKSTPATTVDEGSGTGQDLSKTDNNGTDVPPQD